MDQGGTGSGGLACMLDEMIKWKTVAKFDETTRWKKQNVAERSVIDCD